MITSCLRNDTFVCSCGKYLLSACDLWAPRCVSDAFISLHSGLLWGKMTASKGADGVCACMCMCVCEDQIPQ
jgi:hypothetical protein